MSSSLFKMLVLPLVIVVLTMMMVCKPAGAGQGIHALRTRDVSDEEREPEFISTSTQVTVKQGALAILHCWVRHLGDREVVWRRVADDAFLTIGKVTWVQDSNLVLEHLRKRNGVSTWDLIFRQATLEQAGDYECQVTSQGKLTRTVTLTVLDEPQYSSQTVLPTGQMLHLVCNVSTADITGSDGLHWEKNGRAIDSILHPLIYTTSYLVESSQRLVTDLTIDNVSLDDSGIYTCRSSSRKVVDIIKVTVIRSDPSNSKREEAKGTSMPESTDEMLEDQRVLEEKPPLFRASCKKILETYCYYPCARTNCGAPLSTAVVRLQLHTDVD